MKFRSSAIIQNVAQKVERIEHAEGQVGAKEDRVRRSSLHLAEVLAG